MSLGTSAGRPRGRRLVPFALAAALTAALLGAVGGTTGPVAADDNASTPALLDGSGSAPQGDGAGAGDGSAPQGDGDGAGAGSAPQGDGAGDGDGSAPLDVGSGAGDGAPAARPQQDGGGNLPGEKPPSDSGPGSDTGPRPYTDAAPPVDPGFVDNYTRLWKQVERGKLKVRSLGEDLGAARQVLSASNSDMALAIRARNLADYNLTDASDQFDVAVKDMYITGTTDIDVILGVLGSKPDDVLRTIDSVVYLRTATGTESVDFDFAESAAVLAQSAAASVMIQASDDRDRVDTVRKTLMKTKRELKQDQQELKKLIAVAAPQTVVGNNGCPKEVLEGTVPEGIKIKQLCAIAVRTAASPQAAFAIKWALVRVGAPYACEGIGRLEAWRYDCSSFVSRAYAEGAGLRTAGDGWAPSTRNMVPWDGASLDPHYAVIDPKDIRPGDLALYDTCPAGEVCPYRHVVMYLGPMEKGGQPMMVHTNSCGSVAHVAPFTGIDAANLLGVRRVVPSSGEKIIGKLDPPKQSAAADKPGNKPKKPKKPE